MNRSQKGFTLVEIAIVLVIIGLLLGGMLKGQELIVQGKIKSVANDLSGLSTALYAYQDRYRRLPGDDSQAAERWSGKTTAGNGDGSIGSAGITSIPDCSTTENRSTENCLVWQHLRLSALIVGDATSAIAPQNGAGGPLHIQQGALGLSGIVICASGLSGKIAGALDAQLDDGKPATGQLRATSTANALGNLREGETAYVEDEGTTYVVCKQT